MGQDEKKQAADAAMSDAFAAAERVALLLDRYAGDNGDDAEMIGQWNYVLRQLEAAILRELGFPRTRLPSGGLVPRAKGAA